MHARPPAPATVRGLVIRPGLGDDTIAPVDLPVHAPDPAEPIIGGRTDPWIEPADAGPIIHTSQPAATYLMDATPATAHHPAISGVMCIHGPAHAGRVNAVASALAAWYHHPRPTLPLYGPVLFVGVDEWMWPADMRCDAAEKAAAILADERAHPTRWASA